MTTTPVTSPSDPDQPPAQGASPRLGWWRSREWRTALRMRVGESMYWFAAITGSAAALRCLDANISLPVLKVPGDVGTVVQVVPAVVIAIFVFAAGTLFVVAQVVPQARGTRAVELLRNRYLVWTLSPALALTPLSTAALVLEGAWAKPLASALLIGAAVYLLGSTACLLAVLGEATDPTLYSALLGRRSRAAIAALATPPAAPSRRQRLRRWFRQPPELQQAVDDLYEVIRAQRGWARSSATTGDSRELQIALESTLELVAGYAGAARIEVTLVPTTYCDNARFWRTNPLYPEGEPESLDEELRAWGSWFPSPYRLSEATDSEQPRPLASRNRASADDLPRSWVANEVGRSLVRAIEFATSTGALLDRDRWRILVSLDKAARGFGVEDPVSAGVMVAYVIELGLGVRRCPAEQIEWHFEPLSVLATLHQHFDASAEGTSQGREVLAVGTAAGVLKVAEAIVSARSRAWSDRAPELVDADRRRVIDQTYAARTVEELRAVTALSRFRLFAEHAETDVERVAEEARKLAVSRVLEPLSQPVIHPTDELTVTLLGTSLRMPAQRLARSTAAGPA